MPNRRQIREAAVQFLYCADLEGGAGPAELREPFWEFLTETDRRNLQVATFRTVHHLAVGRESRLSEFVERAQPALAHLSALPQAESLKTSLNRLLALESSWSLGFSSLGKIPKDGDDSAVADEFSSTLDTFFGTDRDLAFHRAQFLKGTEDFPSLKAQIEPVAASVRRLQRISDRLRMVEEPEKFPEQADLTKLRQTKADIAGLRSRTDALVDSIIAAKDGIDSTIASIVENYSPERIDPVDRAILRLGTYEILHTDTPTGAIINEAVELAKRFGTTDSGRFVNGLLDRIAKSRNA
ncbi:MAG: transcription antitermination factor NusB [Akkermansiaceae bacterium]|nr:transcription antitermination factor NusB [Akkermansiaceae bacterium]